MWIIKTTESPHNKEGIYTEHYKLINNFAKKYTSLQSFNSSFFFSAICYYIILRILDIWLAPKLLHIALGCLIALQYELCDEKLKMKFLHVANRKKTMHVNLQNGVSF